MDGIYDEDWLAFVNDLRHARSDPLHFEVMILEMLDMAGVRPLRIPMKDVSLG